MNFADGWDCVSTDLQDWKFHPDSERIDVAICQLNIPEHADHKAVPVDAFVTIDIMRNENIGPGDDVFLTGLFVEHAGKRKNVPIIRAGNIAAMPEEPVTTDWKGEMDAVLVESRSIGGLSGSPVFVHSGIMRNRTISSKPKFWLLGLMHGHWDLRTDGVDATEEDSMYGDRVNMGIAIVVPVEKIVETLFQKHFTEQFRWVEQAMAGLRELAVADTGILAASEVDSLTTTKIIASESTVEEDKKPANSAT